MKTSECRTPTRLPFSIENLFIMSHLTFCCCHFDIYPFPLQRKSNDWWKKKNGEKEDGGKKDEEDEHGKTKKKRTELCPDSEQQMYRTLEEETIDLIKNCPDLFILFWVSDLKCFFIDNRESASIAEKMIKFMKQGALNTHAQILGNKMKEVHRRDCHFYPTRRTLKYNRKQPFILNSSIIVNVIMTIQWVCMCACACVCAIRYPFLSFSMYVYFMNKKT